MMIIKNELKTLIKDISSKYKCNFDGKKCRSNQKSKNYKYSCERRNPKKHPYAKKLYLES